MTIAHRRLKDQSKSSSVLFESLVQKKFLTFDGEIYSLTDSGRLLGKKYKLNGLMIFW
jgi:hypothetical protein